MGVLTLHVSVFHFRSPRPSAALDAIIRREGQKAELLLVDCLMRDHQIGTYGAIALIMAVLLQINAIASLIERDVAARFLVVAPAVSRWAMVLLGRRPPYARPDAGLGRALTDQVRDREVWESTALVLALTTVLARGSGIVSLALTVPLTVGAGFVCWRRIGGITGDTLGAHAALCETIVLVAAVAQSSQ